VEEREAVESLVRPATTEIRVARRGQALLLLADGVGSVDVARLVGVHVRTVYRWKERFSEPKDMATKLADAHRTGRPPSLCQMPTARALRRPLANHPRMLAFP
jgi:transposase